MKSIIALSYKAYTDSLVISSVAVRLRPLNEEEASLTSTPSSSSRFSRHSKHPHDIRAWTCSSNTIEQTGVRHFDGKSLFSFDHMFGEDSSTLQIYDAIVRPIVWGVTNGKHGTVFCYGQTGSGKTFTMQGNDVRVREDDGVLQLAAKDIFQRVGESKKEDSLVQISYFEIYNEQVRDLLSEVGENEHDSTGSGNSNGRGQVLTVRDDPKKGVQVNCRQVQVEDVDTLLDLLQFGNHNRQVAATSMNNRSSRSHAIFRVTVETRSDDGTARVATLNLVDLAGSENSHASNTTNLRQREGGTINKSLLSLSKVVSSLSMPSSKRPKHISYRDSKLTYILQPHLSGNALMAVLCCVSPAHAFVEETRSTLRFASRAKLIETKAQVNELDENDSVLIQNLKRELDATRKSLLIMEQRSAASEQASMDAVTELKKMKELILGDKDSQLAASPGSPRRERKKKRDDRSIPTTIDETKVSSEPDPENYIFDQNMFDQTTTQLSAISRLTNRRDSSDAARAPPSEVLIMTEDPQRFDHMSQLYAADMEQKPQRFDHMSQLYAADMEQKSNFLEHRLETTEVLAEKLKTDLKRARKVIHQLVDKNEHLASKVERYREKLEIADDQEHGKLRAQYILLKWSMYLALLFFFFRMQDLFIVMVMFVWLSLETYTAK